MSRDLIDLAFMMAAWPAADAPQGLAIAHDAYGAIAVSGLDSALANFKNDVR